MNANAAYVAVESLKFTDELLPPAVLAYAGLGLSDKDMFSSTKITRATDAKFDDEGAYACACGWGPTCRVLMF